MGWRKWKEGDGKRGKMRDINEEQKKNKRKRQKE